jgi:hypothetical protein
VGRRGELWVIPTPGCSRIYAIVGGQAQPRRSASGRTPSEGAASACPKARGPLTSRGGGNRAPSTLAGSEPRTRSRDTARNIYQNEPLRGLPAVTAAGRRRGAGGGTGVVGRPSSLTPGRPDRPRLTLSRRGTIPGRSPRKHRIRRVKSAKGRGVIRPSPTLSGSALFSGLPMAFADLVGSPHRVAGPP